MSEIKLIDMLSYLDPELLDNDYIESDLEKLSPSIRNIILIFASLIAIAGVIGVIVRKNKGLDSRKSNFTLPNRVLGLVTN